MEELYPVVPEDFERAGAASMAIKDLLKQLGLPPEFIRRVAIGAYEGEMNCLIHGGGGQVKLQVEPDAIRVQVSDDGPGIPDIPQAMQEGWSTASAKIRSMGFGAGMGLPNMKKCGPAGYPVHSGKGDQGNHDVFPARENGGKDR